MSTEEKNSYDTAQTAKAAHYFLEDQLRAARKARTDAGYAIKLTEAAESTPGTPLHIAEAAVMACHQRTWDANAANASTLRRACEQLEAIILAGVPEPVPAVAPSD